MDPMTDHEENETCKVNVFWTIGDGSQFSISMSRAEAEQELPDLAEVNEDVREWSIQQTQETVPVATGELCTGFGEAVSLDDEGEVTLRQPYQAIHVFWKCPHCGEMHNNNIYQDPVNRTFRFANPSLWFCEKGEGIVMVKWPESED